MTVDGVVVCFWTNTGALTVGDFGAGFLAISGGGVVNSSAVGRGWLAGPA